LKILNESVYQGHRRAVSDLINEIPELNTIYRNREQIGIINFLESENLCVHEILTQFSPPNFFKITQHGQHVINKYGSYFKYRQATRKKVILNRIYLFIIIITSTLAAYYSMRSYYTQNLEKNNNRKINTNYDSSVRHKVIIIPNIKKDSIQKTK